MYMLQWTWVRGLSFPSYSPCIYTPMIFKWHINMRSSSCLRYTSQEMSCVWEEGKYHKKYLYWRHTCIYLEIEIDLNCELGNMSSFYAKLWAYNKRNFHDMRKFPCINLKFFPSHWAYLLWCHGWKGQKIKTLKKGYAFGISWFIVWNAPYLTNLCLKRRYLCDNFCNFAWNRYMRLIQMSNDAYKGEFEI